MDGWTSRWSNLFDDLEGQLEHELAAEDVDLRAEEERLRLGRMSLRDRLDGLRSRPGAPHPRTATICFDDSRTIEFRIATLGRDWASGDLVEAPGRRQCILPLASIAGVVLSNDEAREASLEPPLDEPRGLTARLGLAFVLRDLCRRRRPVDFVLAGGELHGTIDRVARDHCDLAVHAIDVVRRQRAVTQLRIVPFDRLLFVRL